MQKNDWNIIVSFDMRYSGVVLLSERLKISHVALVVKEDNGEAKRISSELVEKLSRIGIEITTVEPLKHKFANSSHSIADLASMNVNLLITIGGDGTILRTVREISDNLPILGINVGGRGILAEVLPSEIPSAIKNLTESNFYLDSRIRIKSRKEGNGFPPALNEIFLDRISQASLPTIGIKTQDIFVEQKMDGLIIATPTGATAHSFSVGGPVLHEMLDLFLLTPICPLLRLPPLVIPTTPMEVSFSDDFNLVVDGQEVYTISDNRKVFIEKHKHNAVFVRFNKMRLRQLHNLGFK